MSGRQKLNLVFLLAAVLIWTTEELHGISGTVVVTSATLLMFPLGMLKVQDLKAVNLKLLIFLTAAFAIGGTLKACGLAKKLFSLFTGIFPSTFSVSYVLMIMLTAMLLHMLLGSNITTMSVVVPGLMTIGTGVAPEGALLFLIYIGICSHFLLPYHHVIILLGEGKHYYPLKNLIRFGLPHTVLTVISALLLYLPWWRLLGLA
jgi:di/tricarboxylate transporter